MTHYKYITGTVVYVENSNVCNITLPYKWTIQKDYQFKAVVPEIGTSK